ncbi:hypothetical protein Tco_0534390 [Tanacetum coccineum]
MKVNEARGAKDTLGILFWGEEGLVGGDESDFHHNDTKIPQTEPEVDMQNFYFEDDANLVEAQRAIKVLKCDHDKVTLHPPKTPRALLGKEKPYGKEMQGCKG